MRPNVARSAVRIIPLVIFILLACNRSVATVAVHFQKSDNSASPIVQAELARSAGERRLGLMYRKELGQQQGMLFIFPSEREQSFWMKNTYLELDIIYIDEDFKIVSIVHKAVPLSETGLKSDGPAKYVLEVVGGMAKQWGLAKGNTLVVAGGQAALQ